MCLPQLVNDPLNSWLGVKHFSHLATVVGQQYFGSLPILKFITFRLKITQATPKVVQPSL